MSEIVIITTPPAIVETLTPTPSVVEILEDSGPQGPAGFGSEITYHQGVPSSSWIVTHSLNHPPQVRVTDDSGNAVIVDIEVDITSPYTVHIHLSSPLTGFAYLV